jgi:hypothetical protein
MATATRFFTRPAAYLAIGLLGVAVAARANVAPQAVSQACLAEALCSNAYYEGAAVAGTNRALVAFLVREWRKAAGDVARAMTRAPELAR